MAVVFEGITDSGNSGSELTFTVNMPATRPDGDLYVAILAKDGGADFATAPSGWTRATSSGAGTGVKAGVWYRVGSGGEPASYQWTVTTSETFRGSMLRFSGINSSVPIPAGTVGENTGNGTVATCPSVSGLNSTANDFVVRSAGFDTGIAMTTAWAQSGNTERSYNRTGGTTPVGFGVTMSISTDDAVTDATGTITHTADTADDWHAITFVVETASGGGNAIRSRTGLIGA